MGNQMSVPRRNEDQENESETETYKDIQQCLDTFLIVTTQGESDTSIQSVEARELAKPSTVHRMSRGRELADPISTMLRMKTQVTPSVLFQVTWDHECDQNGSAVIVSTHTVQHYDEVDLGISMKTDNVAASSPKTMDISAATDANGKNLGKEAKSEAPAAKSRFFLTLSRPVPGRPGDQGSDSSPGAAKLDVSSSEAPPNKDPSESVALPVAAAPGPDTDKTPGQTPAKDEALSATWALAPAPPESGEKAPSKPKDFNFFEKLFKLDKGQEKVSSNSQQEAKRAEPQDEADENPGLASQPVGVPTGEDIATGEEEGGGGGQEIGSLSCSVPDGPDKPEASKADFKFRDTTEDNSPIMSFFKTLVSPNKTETKKDPEDTASKAEIVCDGHAGQKTSETQAKGPKKKQLDSPSLGLAFRKFFRHKGAVQSPTTPDLKSDKADAVPSETPGPAKGAKGCNPATPSQPGTPLETMKDGAREKPGPTALPLGKLFWKKSIREDSVPTVSPGAEENMAVCDAPVEVPKSEEVEPALQTVDLNEEEVPPEDTEVKREERKPPQSSFMAFLRQMSVKGDGGTTRSEEVSGKDSSYQTSNSTEKAVSLPEPEPVGIPPKGREGSLKDKKSAGETSKRKNSKQEAAVAAQGPEQAVVDGNALREGDRPQKRAEKRRQSLGGFLKGLGPKRMSDAQVQTDPVSIGPVGKNK
ncbi:breast carcinoma-amplified sequence 1 [Ochotona princeps]|uniref:breast carcinoma-amplified sequence 1 n=1 Tax=Ochotona princeps TaxID=9978 RepID=UPI002714AF03|nr:breast carcinoma-amplified sequence 1 [Ochotona princeps]